MLMRTPLLAVIIAGFLAIIIVFIFEIPSRPFSIGELSLLYFLSLLTSIGFALLMDPMSKKTKEELCKINFYQEKK